VTYGTEKSLEGSLHSDATHRRFLEVLTLLKAIRLVTLVAALAAGTIFAQAPDVTPVHLDDAAWVKDTGDRLARCAGTYRGAAEVMRQSGRLQAATYAEGVASGALFAAYLLLSSPVAVEAKVLDTVDTNVHIEALAWGATRRCRMCFGAARRRAHCNRPS